MYPLYLYIIHISLYNVYPLYILNLSPAYVGIGDVMTTNRYDILEIDMMLKKGISLRSIAKHYKVNHGALMGWIKRNNYKIIEKKYIDPDTLKGKVIG